MTKDVLKLGDEFFMCYSDEKTNPEKKRDLIIKILKSIDTGKPLCKSISFELYFDSVLQGGWKYSDNSEGPDCSNISNVVRIFPTPL